MSKHRFGSKYQSQLRTQQAASSNSSRPVSVVPTTTCSQTKINHHGSNNNLPLATKAAASSLVLGQTSHRIPVSPSTTSSRCALYPVAAPLNAKSAITTCLNYASRDIAAESVWTDFLRFLMRSACWLMR